MERPSLTVPRLVLPSVSATNSLPEFNETGSLPSGIPSLNLAPLSGSPLHPDWVPEPRVKVSLFHTNDRLHLKFEVEEYGRRAEVLQDMGPVWEDSCVECFVSLSPDEPGGAYYNFEFNALGRLYLSYGTGRTGRVPAPVGVLSQIARFPAWRDPESSLPGMAAWELRASIPCEAFFEDFLTSFSGLRMKANFFKCGNRLTFPHYLSWSPMSPGKPDFHQPGFFGSLFLGI
jgi:hypothetical protein